MKHLESKLKSNLRFLMHKIAFLVIFAQICVRNSISIRVRAEKTFRNVCFCTVFRNSLLEIENQFAVAAQKTQFGFNFVHGGLRQGIFLLPFSVPFM
jgi:hypothetical protein